MARKKLGDVCDIVNGSTPKRSVSEYWENGNVPWFTVDDIRSNGRIISKTNQSITDKALKETSVKLLPEDSVLLCCTASLGEVALIKIPLTTNQQFNGLVSKDKKNLFPYYLYYSAQKLGEGLKSKSGKTTINFLSVGSLSKEKVLVPPIKEQQKIAEILGAVDEGIAKTQEVIKATEKLKRGLMQQLFTRGIGHTKFKETKIGQIPEGWEANELGSYLLRNPDYGINAAGVDYTQELPTYIRITDISEDGKFIFQNKKSVDHKDSASYILQEGDLVFARTGASVGKTYLYNSEDGQLVFAGFLIRMQVDKEKMLPKYLSYYVQTPTYWNWVRVMSTRSGQPGINGNEYAGMVIPVPKMSEQEKCVEILSAVDEKISVNKKLKAKLTFFKKGLMQDLLSGKVRTNI